MEKIPDKIDSKFRFVLLAARRAEQMMRGAQPRVEIEGSKPTRVAMEEIFKESIDWDYGSPNDLPPGNEAYDEAERH